MFVGGCTMAEIAALRFLSQQVGYFIFWFLKLHLQQYAGVKRKFIFHGVKDKIKSYWEENEMKKD